MKSEIIIIVIIEIVILYISLRIWYISYKKKEQEIEQRFLVLEKRINDNTQLIKLEIKGVLNNIELRERKKKK